MPFTTPELAPDDRGTPVVDAMSLWLSGDASVPSLTEFFARFGSVFRNYRLALVDRLGQPNYRWSPPEESMSLFGERQKFIAEYGFAIPVRGALDRLAGLGPLLEVGAGTGAWAELLRARGCDIVATDAMLEDFPFRIGRWHPVIELQAKAAVRRWPERNVFCSWPSLTQSWLRQAARAMRPGRTLAVVREDATADDSTWDYIDEAFRSIGIVELPCWYGLHDVLEIWVKRG